MHEPALVMCTVLPADVHTPLAEKLTGKPEVAVAFSEKSGSLTDLFANAPNVIVWSALPTVSVKLASVVAKQLSVAAIVMVCVPAGAALPIETKPVVSLTPMLPLYVPLDCLAMKETLPLSEGPVAGLMVIDPFRATV